MTLLDRYVGGQLIRPFLAILLAALLVLLAERALRVVDIVIDWRGGLLVIFEMLGYLVPTYMSLALPTAFFIAVLLTVGRLSRDGELDAMMASGNGFLALLRPLLLTALLVTVVNAAVQSHLQPFSRYAYRAALFTLSNVSFQVLLNDRQFVSVGDTTYSVDWISADKAHFAGLFLARELSNDGMETITADRGEILPAQGNEPTLMRLQDGVRQSVSGGNGSSPPSATTVRFRTFVTDLRGNEPEAFAPRGESERELTLPELLANPTGFPERGIAAAEITAELHVRLARIVSTLVLPLVAAPLAVARRRSRRSFGFLAGVVLLLVFNQVLQLGKTLADDGRLPVLVGMWLPVLAFALLGLALTYWKAARVPSGSGTSRVERAIERFGGALQRRLPLVGER